ncbi:MAG: hydantoinase/oxoprolinase family protein [Acidimicrobiia bacterium]|nr:hydantoinase/oxoprolinase family protein [Acidimicrobiia bacterium]
MSPSTDTGYRVGIDVGGTFTDVICVTPSGEVVLDKTPTVPQDQSIGVMNGLSQLAERFGLSIADFCSQTDIVVHGTTTADNTMIEMNGANTGLLVTKGHRDEIEMRRVHKEQIWDPSYPAPTPIARRRARIAIAQRMDHNGVVLLPLDEEAVRAGVQRLRLLGVESIAIMFLFSFVNPAHELRAAEIVREEYPDISHISLSHEVMARGPEFERVSTTLVNAYVAPRIATYVDRLQNTLRESGYAGQLLIMSSSGGVMPPEYVARRAVTLLASGPTGGVMGATLAATRAGVNDFIAVDMGGTSYDLALVRGGRPEIKTDWNWRYRYYIGLPMVDVQSVGAGGGSIARVRQGALLVGPESAGSAPGPACYRRGGENPTVTDADLVLGYLPATGFAGGRMTLDVDAARTAIERDVAIPLGIDVIEAAWGIERIVNTSMANATRRVLASHGADPRILSLIAYGGNGAVHAWAIARDLGIDRILIPKAAPAFSALGVLVADYVVDLVRSYIVPLSQVDVVHMRTLIGEIVEEARKEMQPAGLADDATSIDLYAQMCYPGQNFDMSVPLPEGADLDGETLLELAERFHTQHEAERGFSFRNQQPLMRGVRLVARSETPKPDHFAEPGTVTDAAAALKGHRDAYFGVEFVSTPIYDGPQLGAGVTITGPALIEEPFTVIVVPPGSTATLDSTGNYVLMLSESRDT